MPANSKVLEIQGRNQDSEGTLWDQDARETAIRILVEEAKVSLCLRIMFDFKVWQHAAGKAECIEQARQQFDFQESHVLHKLQQFEEYLGLLLCRALVHVETLQLMDIPLLVEHITFVLQKASGSTPGSAAPKLQETMVLYYFSSLLKHAEALNSQELLHQVRERGALQLATVQLLDIVSNCPADVPADVHRRYAMDVSRAASSGLAALADNEDFKTSWEDFFLDESGCDRPFKQRFLELDAALVQPVLKDSPAKRAELRPLTDLFRTIQRKL